MRYLDGLKTIPNTDPDNALILGTALHTGIEEGVDQALDFYQNSFPVLTDEHITEMMKLEALIPKAKALLPPGGRFEVPIGDADFIGFIDYLVPVQLDLHGKDEICDHCDREPRCPEAYGGQCSWGKFSEASKDTYDLYDFKYTGNSRSYVDSDQLHLYKYWFELTHPGCKIRNLWFLFVPKVKIRQKGNETLIQFRERLREALMDAKPWVSNIDFDPLKVVQFLTHSKRMIETTEFERKPNHFCGWCEFEEYCQKGVDYMILPKNERRSANAKEKKVIWIYGAPFSGKTTFANAFPDPLMLNTDGNVKVVSGIDAPYIPIRDEVTVEGRITKRKMAYEVFLDAVAELEKKQNDFKTIVVDLLEDVYEGCRVYICDRQGWKHESDDSFRAWDMVRSEFLNTLKRLINLDYENIVLISHEDRSRDLTRKGGDKISSIKPNIQDKVANKVAGMVDLVARIVADDSERVLSFKTSEVIFGGGRLTVRNKEIPLDYAAFCEVYAEANTKAVDKPKADGGTVTPPKAETADSAPQEGRRKGRKPKEEPPAPEAEPETGTFAPGGSDDPEEAPSGDTPPWEDDPQLPGCPDGERIFRQHEENPAIPLCKNIDAGHHCHKEGGPDTCPLWDRPKADPEPAPKMDVNPPKRTRKKRGEA